MEAVGKFNFAATAHDELSFKKGELLKILVTEDDWYKAELGGVDGFVPRNYLDVQLPSWYQETSSRSHANHALMPRPLGSFLIRGSQSSPGDFSISVRHETDVQHFKVMRDRGQYSVWKDKFPSLNKLVEFYKRNSVAKHSTIYLLEDAVQREAGQSRLPPPLSHGPPHPAPRPQVPVVEQVRALYSFSAEEPDELDFSAGDIIDVLERPDPSWWRGQLRERTGLFPSNYTTPV